MEGKRKDYAKAEQYVRALLKQYKDNKQVRTPYCSGNRPRGTGAIGDTL